jgi:hypothetical protein
VLVRADDLTFGIGCVEDSRAVSEKVIPKKERRAKKQREEGWKQILPFSRAGLSDRPTGTVRSGVRVLTRRRKCLTIYFEF